MRFEAVWLSLSFQVWQEGLKAVHKREGFYGGWTEVERRASDSINVISEHRDINQVPPNTALLIPQADTNNLSTCEVPGVRGSQGRA